MAVCRRLRRTVCDGVAMIHTTRQLCQARRMSNDGGKQQLRRRPHHRGCKQSRLQMVTPDGRKIARIHYPEKGRKPIAQVMKAAAYGSSIN